MQQNEAGKFNSNSNFIETCTYLLLQEAELLEFTQKLTDKNVNLQSEFSSMELREKSVWKRACSLGDDVAVEITSHCSVFYCLVCLKNAFPW